MKVYILKRFGITLYVGYSLKAVREYAKKICDSEVLGSTYIAECEIDSDEVKFHSTIEGGKMETKRGIMIVHGSDTDGDTFDLIIKNVTELDSAEAWNEQFLYSPEGWYNYSWFPNWEAVPEKYKKGGENEEENKTDSPS